MNKLTKVGLSALAGSLAVVSANASEYSVTGDTQVVRKGQFGNDDVIGTVQQNGDGSSSFTAFKGSNGQNGTSAEIEYFSKPENVTKVKNYANKVAMNQYNNLSDEEKKKFTPPNKLIYNEEDLNSLNEDFNINDLGNPLDDEGQFQGSKSLKARKSYRKDLEYPLGIGDLPQDKLRISVVKFEPAESQGSFSLDELRQA